jgi:rubrerythrin
MGYAAKRAEQHPMKTFSSVDEILDYAISREDMAAKFYRSLANRVQRPGMKDVCEAFARDEDGHKSSLLQVKAGKSMQPTAEHVIDLKISDYLADAEDSDEMDYQQALVVAMKREKASFKLYTDLAAVTADPTVRDTLLRLAQEEAKHKLRFELEYDQVVLTQN